MLNYSKFHSTSWLFNTEHAMNTIFSAEVDIIIRENSKNDAFHWTVECSGIPGYSTNITTMILESLTSRPTASEDFINKSTLATLGYSYEFGANIGYASKSCSLGYWPPGPSCPIADNRQYSFPLQPIIDFVQKTIIGLGPIGLFINGATIYGFKDAHSYKNLNQWENLAPELERYDLDICLGHADPSGTYHHHQYSDCLRIQSGDTQDQHSPIYGWLQDGFPLYGPYQGESLLAKSCWIQRDYTSASSGCPDGRRSCILNNPTDLGEGAYTLPQVLHGPDPSSFILSMSGDKIPATSGIYYQDYYFNKSCYEQGGASLNVNNGHIHDDLGFHYHITLDSQLHPVFPYLVGPKLYGKGPTAESLILRVGIVFVSLFLFGIVFYTAGIICDEYLVPSVEVFIIQFKIPEELAAVTLVAFGNAAPELTLDTLGALKSQSSLSIPTTLGSAIIAFGLIPPLSVLLSQERLFILSALPIAREIFFYAAGLSIFLYSISDGYIQLEEAICLACVYVIYVSSVIGYYYLYPPSNNTSSILPQDEEEEADNEIILYPSGGSEDEEGGPLLSRSQSPLSTLMRVCGWIGYPIRCLISTCMPNLRADGSPKTRVSLVRAVTVLSVSILLVGLLSNLIINICGVIINQMNVDPSTLGATLVALGAEIPDTLSAIALAKKGYTDGAMAGAIGSQVINISLGVGLPSMLVCLFGKGVVIIHDNISSIWLLTYLVFVTVIAYMLVTLPLVRLVTCTLNSQAIETLYADRSAGTVKTHITKLGAIFLLLVYISVYSFFLYENEDGDR